MAERDDVVVVTGASAGVGRATAIEFGRHGARVALLARNAQRLAAAKQEVEAAGGQALTISVDVADADAVEAAAAEVERRFGPIDVWVNSAMATIFAPVQQIEPDEIRRATEVTYLGTVYGTMAALRRMRARGRGTIVQVGSALSYRAIPLQSAYCAAKFAIRGFTDALRCELMHDRIDIHVTMAQLSAHNTPQFDWGRNKMPKRPQPVPPIFQPEVAARGIHYAAYARRREVWVGWPAVKAIVGNKLVPWLADRMLAKSGYSGQMDSEPAIAGRPDNLFESPDFEVGTHGRFDARARWHSRQWWLNTHRGLVVLVVGLVLLAIAIAVGIAV